jgi:DNA-binding SARP family transcriptional activator
MEHYIACGDFEAALATGQELLRLEPLDEMVQQRVIELYAATGQRAAALRQYKRLAALLKSELGVAPARETRALIDRIRSEAACRMTQDGAKPAQPSLSA